MDYDNDDLMELCSKINLLEYAQQSYNFEKRGSDCYATHCPFHIDKTPSLIITPSKNLFHCFSCHIGGNLINWLMTFEKLSFPAAIKKVGVLTGTDINSLKQCDALKFFKKVHKLTNTQKPTEINREILDLSVLNQYSDDIPTEWESEGIIPEVMRKYGIRIDYDSNRIVYPIYDNNENLIGIKGRTRYLNYKEMGIQKYMNYQKIGTTDFFIGMKENRESILRHNEAIVFEGIKSGMKVEGWGYDYWLASETGWLNEEQVKILVKLKIKNITIAFDKDVPSDKIRGCTQILKRFMNVFVVRDNHGLLNDKDSPCDQGLEIWKKLYSERQILR